MARDFVGSVYKANVDLNGDNLSAMYDSVSYLGIESGKIQGYKDAFKDPKQLFSNFENLKVDILNSQYSVIDASTVLYAEVSRFEASYKDSSVLVGKPWNLSYLLKKVNNQWKIIGGVSFGHTEISKGSSQTPTLNQLELYRKNYMGTRFGSAINYHFPLCIPTHALDVHIVQTG